MKVQKCKNCTYYSDYYKKWSDHYSRMDKGFCSQHQKTQTQYATCDNFKSNEQKEKTREERLFLSLERALTAVDEIAKILKEKENNE